LGDDGRRKRRNARGEPRIPKDQAGQLATRSGAPLELGLVRTEWRVGRRSAPLRTVCRTNRSKTPERSTRLAGYHLTSGETAASIVLGLLSFFKLAGALLCHLRKEAIVHNESK
jgi:hypothetical protein